MNFVLFYLLLNNHHYIWNQISTEPKLTYWKYTVHKVTQFVYWRSDGLQSGKAHSAKAINITVDSKLNKTYVCWESPHFRMHTYTRHNQNLNSRPEPRSQALGQRNLDSRAHSYPKPWQDT